MATSLAYLEYFSVAEYVFRCLRRYLERAVNSDLPSLNPGFYCHLAKGSLSFLLLVIREFLSRWVSIFCVPIVGVFSLFDLWRRSKRVLIHRNSYWHFAPAFKPECLSVVSSRIVFCLGLLGRKYL